MDAPIITLASLNTMPMDMAARQMNLAVRRVADQLMALHRAIRSSYCVLNDGITAYTFIMTRKELRLHMKRNGYMKYEITEELFPKKKKRGSMRRARIERKCGKFNDPPLPDGVYIDEWLDPPMTPPISREEFMQKASFSAPFDVTDDQFDGDPVLIIPGPFDGKEKS